MSLTAICTIGPEQPRMPIFQIFASGHHGYPQPEDGYQRLVYADHCSRCGIHGGQTAPFGLKRERRAPNSGFLQLNWVFDVFFAHPDVAAELSTACITGLSFGPAVEHRKGTELGDRVQLQFPAIIACAETSRLQMVTCRPGNEEGAVKGFAGATQFTGETPYCGRVKHHPPTTLAINLAAVRGAPDLFQTAEWFGSAAGAHRLTLGSHRFVELVHQRGWRGLQFRAVREEGYSERVSPLRKKF